MFDIHWECVHCIPNVVKGFTHCHVLASAFHIRGPMCNTGLTGLIALLCLLVRRINQTFLKKITTTCVSWIFRAEEADDIVLSSSEIKRLALRIEEELFKVYSNTGHKYRAKFRSLLFNIKDQKNKVRLFDVSLVLLFSCVWTCSM